MRLEEQLGKFEQQKAEQYTTQEKDFNPTLPDSLDLPDDSALKTIFQRLGSETTNRLVSLCMKGENFTGQEQKVLELILKGLANKEIAKELHIEVTTVKAHLKNAFQKLGVTTRSQAIAYLLIKGLLRNTSSTT